MHLAALPDVTRERAHHHLRAIFSRRGFRRLLAVRLASQLGDGLFQAGLAGSIFFNPERATGPLAIAIAFAVLLVPYSTIGPFVGVVLDRWSRRQVLFVANSMRAALVLPAAWLVWRGDERMLFVLVALGIVALNRFFLAGLSAAQPHVADERQLVTANSLATTAGSVTYAGALGGAAALVHLTGTDYHSYAAVAGVAALAYGLSAGLTLVSFHIDELGPDDAERVRGSVAGAIANTVRGMLAGVHHLARRPVAAQVMTVQTLHRGLYGVLAIMTLLLYRNYFHPGNPQASVAGLLPIAAAAAAGALIAALVTPAASRRFGGWRWVVGLLLLLAVGLPAFCLPVREALIVCAAGLVSVVSQGLKIVSDTTLQVQCADDYRGRVFSVNDTAYNLFFVGGLFVGALLLPAAGHSAGALITVAVAYAAVAAWYGAVSARREAMVPAA